MARIKALIFDWDGTIVDTLSIKMENAAAIFSDNFGTDGLSIAHSYKRYSGVSRKDLFNMIARDNMNRELHPLEFKRISAEFTSRNLVSARERRIFAEENRSLFNWCTESGYGMFISSSADKNEIEELAELIDVKKYFREILGSAGEFSKGKAHIRYIKEKYQYTTDQIMFVGDDKADMRLAGRLGVLCVGVLNGGQGDRDILNGYADHWITSLSQLREVLIHA